MTAATGKFAFNMQPTGAPSSQGTSTVLTATIAGPLAVPWTITLAAWQGAGGFPRNQTGLPLATLKARLTWGGGGANGGGSAQEIALVDYPAGGAVYTVLGTNVKVDIVWTMPGVGVNDAAPLLGGWVSHGHAAARPWLAGLQEPSRGGNAVLLVPPRARGYRVFSPSGLDGSTIVVIQQSGEATPLTVQRDTWSLSALASQDWDWPSSRAQWYPLHPDAQTLVVTPPVGPSYSVQWMLELG